MAQSGFDGKRCFLTGAASGIGRATALKLAAQGAELYLTDRDEEGLAATVADARALGATVPEHRVLDISDYDAVARFAADIHAEHPAMDVVMNIAGVSAWGTVDKLAHEHWKSMVDINLMGPIRVIEAFVPPMVEARTAAATWLTCPRSRDWWPCRGTRPTVRASTGCADFSEVCCGSTWRGTGVSVVVPGAVKTPLVQTVQIAGVDREDPNVKKWTDRFAGHAVSPEHVADRILRGVVKNRFLIYTSPDIRALYMFKRTMWWPYSVAMRQANVVFTRALRPANRTR